MLRIKIGVQLASLRMPFKDALRTAAELKVDAVEIDARGELNPREMSQTAYRQVRKMLEDYRLAVSAVGFRTRHGYNVVEGLDRRIEATRQAMDFAYRLGANVVVNYVGAIPGEGDERGWELLRETLGDLGRYGQRAGAMLAARTGAESGEDMQRLLANVPAGTLGIDFDPGGLVVNGFSASDAIRRLAEHVLHVHARDGVRDLAQGRGLETPLGQGAVDIPDMLSVLEEKDYRGYLTIERETARDPLSDIAAAVKWLRRL
jgi:sugar phosphate isomerase/epimerase